MTIPRDLGRHLLLVAALGALISTGAAGQRPASSSAPPPPTSTSIVVKLRDAADTGALRAAPGVRAVDAFLPNAPAIGRRSAARHAGRDARGPDGAAAEVMALEAGFARTFIVRVTDTAAVAATLARFRQDPAVEYAERDAPMAAQWTPNDPYFASSASWGQPHADLYGLHRIQAAAAWDVSRGAGIVVAVTDTGLDRTHADIDAKVWVNPGEIAGNGLDDDGNGYIDDVHGWDFAYYDADPRDRHGHGTHVAGIVGAEGNNADGIVGTAPDVRIMPVQVLQDYGGGAYTMGAAGIVYAVMNGADVVNVSWVGESPSVLLEETVRYAYARGVLVVACAGNAGLDTADFMPASIAEAVTVASSDHLDRLAADSNRGIGVDVTAPGVGILSLRAFGVDPYGGGTHVVGGRYYWASGTSMAAGYVTGAVAALLSRFPAEKISVTRDRLAFTADPIENGMQAGSIGGGRLNLARALTEPLGPAELTLSGRVIDRQGAPMPGVTVALGEMASQRVVTGGDGRYRFVNLRPRGNYATRASQLGVEFLPGQTYYAELSTNPIDQTIVGVRRWTHDPVDTTWASGYSGLSLALDGAGQPRVAYHLPFEREVRYAASTPQGWTVEIVESAAASGAADVGNYSSLALDAGGRPHIVYARFFSDGTSAIRYARRGASAWIIEDVSNAQVAWQPRFALDSAGQPHIIEKTPTPGFLRHWWKEANANYWHAEYIVGAPFIGLADMAIDGQDRVHVAYQATVGGTEIDAGFWHAVREPWGWRHVQVNAVPFSGLPASFAFAGGQPRLAYGYYQAFGVNPSLQYAEWNGASWQSTPIQQGLLPFGVSLVGDVAGGSLAVYDSGPGGLTSALRLGGGWLRQLVRRGLAGAYTDLARDAQGAAHLVYTDRHTGFAWHARSLELVDPAWTPPVVALTAPGQGHTISGIVEVRVTAGSPLGITRVELRFDGDGPLATLTAAPYGIGWDTRLLSNGAHSLTARAFDVTGAVATHTITVTVQNVVQ